jgi:HD-like signal output (HDOD) protein/ActR/RegA family two-component response regulator
MSTFHISKATLNRRRVLFVDDEPFALEVLQRVFEPMRNEWHMEFLTSGESALNRLDELDFDAVVSDLTMPGMTGAEFLSQVQQRHPATSRIILSGQADEELIYKTVTSAHQFISKTADPKLLLKKVRKLVLLRNSRLTPELVEMICALERLPSVPKVYCDIVEATAKPDCDLREIAEAIRQDAATGAKVLQLANSAFFGLRGEVSSINDAVAFLGIETVRYLVLMVGVCEQFRSTRFSPGFVEQVWTHSVQTANLARIIAETEHTSLALAEQAFVGGLMHDVGKLVFAENLSKSYREVLDFSKLHGQPAWQVERQILQATHADIGGYLLDLWGLPETVTKAVSLHHQPIAEETEGLTPLAIVHVANHFAHELTIGGEPSGELDSDYLEVNGLAERVPVWREAIEQTMAQAAV